jgi:hypothetical protein
MTSLNQRIETKLQTFVRRMSYFFIGIIIGYVIWRVIKIRLMG